MRQGAIQSALTCGEVSRILDFGCGDGVELAKTARSFGLSASDTFGIGANFLFIVTFLEANLELAHKY